MKSDRNEFDKKTKELLAKRAGYLCSICKAYTKHTFKYKRQKGGYIALVQTGIYSTKEA